MRQTKLKIWTLELCAKMAFPSHLRFIAFSFLILLLCLSNSIAQVKEKLPTPATPAMPAPTAKPLPRIPMARTPRYPAKRVHNESETPAEKSISTDTKVNITLCVSEGNVKINGWEHNEIRAFVDGGSEVGFLVRSKNRQTGKPDWVNILGFDPQKNREPGLERCLSGDEIEIDVPRGATVNYIGTETTVSIESVYKVDVRNDAGNVSLRGITQRIDARTYQGDVTVENSSGVMILTSTSGNIIAFETQAGEVGDFFKAKTTSGAITLQGVEHRQISADSASGAIRFNGDFTSGGQYSFGTTNGSINLIVPLETSFKIIAQYAGSFRSDIPLKEIIKTSGSPITLTALAGSGDANLSLRTLGAIRIIKK